MYQSNICFQNFKICSGYSYAVFTRKKNAILKFWPYYWPLGQRSNLKIFCHGFYIGCQNLMAIGSTAFEILSKIEAAAAAHPETGNQYSCALSEPAIIISDNAENQVVRFESKSNNSSRKELIII